MSSSTDSIQQQTAASDSKGISQPVVRSLALFLGGFTLLNVLGEFRLRGFDANEWWIDCRRLPAGVGTGLLLLGGLGMVAYAIRPGMAAWHRILTAGVLVGLLGLALSNVVQFWQLMAGGQIRAGLILPFSLLVGVVLAIILWRILRPGKPAASEGHPRWNLILSVGTLAVCGLGFPLAQMYCFGKTDYRRTADVAVVFGARAYADGKCSDALRDRVTTACRLYQDGLVGKLLFSGGPADGSMHETEAMRRLAVSLGVRDEDILLDRQGLDTDATVRNTCNHFRELGVRRVLAVSHFYHLPRVKMRYHREGHEVYTVPAEERYTLRSMPWLMGREIAAMWAYYARPLIQ